ncbi:glycosyltransferase family 2 protein [Buttiauxella sp. WJP83]|uniref:glycosyltransferase n=1 Tax=Buttiauxella sp. WJP83 TaxID=2986951 RepID=UPI0022DD959F|nr:glycosyltransferase family A protein [Buttiauxella sp. WJP83]WBM72084.1 glycosyltransferase family 2 protein [Buttiauxella sp. WJP83]
MTALSTPKVSVCILTKNPGYIFREVIQSVLMQNTNFEYEVVVVDSGSTDGTIDYIEKIVDPRLKLLIIKPTDFGHGKTRNWAIENSSGEFAVMITHDAKPLNNFWLENLISPFETDPDIAGVFGRHVAYEDASVFTKRDLQLHFDGFKSNKVVALDDSERYATDEGYKQFLHYFSDNNAALRRSVWLLYPYPEVDFAEDQLWAKLIIEKGYKKAYADDAVVYHSHNYSLVQTFKRSYDESRALRRLFNYNICPRLLNIGYQTLRCSHRDIKYYRELNNGCNLLKKIEIITFHFLKQTGFYIGSNYPDNKFLFRLISLDNSLKRK